MSNVVWVNMGELSILLAVWENSLAAVCEMQSADLGFTLELSIDVRLGLATMGCPAHAGSWPDLDHFL